MKNRTLIVLAAVLMGLCALSKDVVFTGAKDGSRLVTVELQKAIDDVSASGGGRLTLEAGTYLSGSILLKDNVTLHLAKGATLLGSTNRLDYTLHSHARTAPAWAGGRERTAAALRAGRLHGRDVHQHHQVGAST